MARCALLLLALAGAEEEDGVWLLQTGVARLPGRKPKATLFQEPARPDESILPLAWLHIPKCGSSLLNALIKVPGACPAVPRDVVISDSTMGADNIAGFWAQYPTNVYCKGAFYTWGNHNGVGSEANYEQHWKGHGVTMLRDPLQRAISSRRDNSHSWPLAVGNPPPEERADYFDQIQGCAVRMLTRSGVSHVVPELHNEHAVGPHWGGPCGSGELPSAEEVEEAKRRLRGFLFVGLQEEWELSICLLHATVGGRCYAAEFLNTRHEENEKREYNESRWMPGFEDPYDGELYREGKRLFRERFKEKGLSVEVCQTCFEQAGVQYP